MSLNCVEINSVIVELDIAGSFIQTIIQTSYDSIALYTHPNEANTVFLCLAPGACPLH